jgi:hypothetical protein
MPIDANNCEQHNNLEFIVISGNVAEVKMTLNCGFMLRKL